MNIKNNFLLVFLIKLGIKDVFYDTIREKGFTNMAINIYIKSHGNSYDAILYVYDRFFNNNGNLDWSQINILYRESYMKIRSK